MRHKTHQKSHHKQARMDLTSKYMSYTDKWYIVLFSNEKDKACLALMPGIAIGMTSKHSSRLCTRKLAKSMMVKGMIFNVKTPFTFLHVKKIQ